MKSIWTSTALVALVLGLGCETQPEGFVVNGLIEGELAQGTKVYLKAMNEQSRLSDRDTAVVTAGAFSFEGKADVPELHYLFIEGTRGNIPLILENGTIDVTTHKDSLSFAQTGGTPQNEYFQDYMAYSRQMSSKAASIQQDMRQAAAAKDTAIAASLQDEFLELQEEARAYEVSFVKDNPDALMSLLLLERINATKTLPEHEIRNLLNALAPTLKETALGKRLKTNLEKGMRVAIGTKAPNFTAPTPSGTQLSLNEVLGKATIVDFWAAWCKPCRIENPNVVRVYNKYKDKGLSIIGVSLDRKAEDWIQAIADDKLTWHHVSNVRYFDEIAALYNVNGIPATFILDEDGIIVAKNLRGPALEEKIKELLD